MQLHTLQNPTHHEGDSRTWEALVSGALVFVDRTRGRLPYALQHRRHVIFYEPLDVTDLAAKLTFYLAPENADEAAAIAARGRRHALRHHRAVNRIDYYLLTALHEQRRRNASLALAADERTRALVGAAAKTGTGADDGDSDSNNVDITDVISLRPRLPRA
jgi:hypothetical protein